MIDRLNRRAHHSGPHGHGHISRQRRTALIMIVTGLSRVLCWLTLIGLYLAGVDFTRHLFASVAFVAVISLYANAATDWGQVAASLAQLTAGDAHADAEQGRRDIHRVEQAVCPHCGLRPGPDL